MAWRHRDMENALGGVIDRSMTPEMVSRLVAEFARESEFVDYKSKDVLLGKHKEPKKWRFDCGKDVAAFANARGGVLIFGVRDAKNLAPGEDPLDPFTPKDGDPDDLESKFRTAARGVTAPVPSFDMFAVQTAAETFFMVCVVPPSELAPHAVTMPGDGRDGLVYPVRAAGQAEAVFLREFQVAELYERRARSSVDRRRRAETVWEDGCTALDVAGAPQVWVAVASIPDHAGDDLLTPQAQREIKDWADTDSFPTLIERGFIGYGHLVPSPGRMCLTQTRASDGRKQVSAVQDFYAEIHADGSLFAAVPVSESTDTSPFTIGVDEIVDVVASSTSHALQWTAHRTGLWGSTTVTAGVVVVGPRQDTVLQIRDFGGLPTPRQITRPLTRNWPRMTTVVELASTGSMRERLAVAYRLATPLVQAFGVPDLYWLSESGELRLGNVRRDRLPAARQWAQDHGV